ncbi:MAG: hypothetical protein K6G08_06885 [Prevotella sp.]|nr:hypothetical protein [Prevotella sp.]
MSKAKDNNHISLANIISVIGIVLLAAALFLGYFYSGDNMGISALKALAWTIGFAVLLWFLIKAKSAINELKKWRVVEIITLVVYLALAVLSSGTAAKFFNIYAANGDLRKAAGDDVEALQQTIKQFKSDANNALSVTLDGMENADGNVLSSELQNFMDEQDLSSFDATSRDFFSEGAGGWRNKINDITLDKKSYDKSWENALKECSEQIDGWSVLEIPQAVRSLEDISEEIDVTLNALSKKLPFPEINYNSTTFEYEISKAYSPKEYSTETSFSEKLNAIKPYAPIGIIACVLIHLLILFNYFVAYRSDKIRPAKSSKEANQAAGGIMLK